MSQKALSEVTRPLSMRRPKGACRPEGGNRRLLGFTPLCNRFRVILGLNIYYIENRPTTTRYFTNLGAEPHQNGQGIRRIR